MPFPAQSDGLTLRLMAPGDAAEVRRVRLHPDVVRFQTWRPASDDVVVAHAQAQAGATPGTFDGCVQLVIEADGVVVGDLGVVTVEAGRCVELGVALDPPRWGEGLATRACRLLLTTLFADGLHRVVARVDPANVRSLALLDRLRFRREGYAVEAWWDDDLGAWTDEVCLALLAREWPPD